MAADEENQIPQQPATTAPNECLSLDNTTHDAVQDQIQQHQPAASSGLDPTIKKTDTRSTTPPRHTAFGPWEKKFIVFMASLGSFISPLSSNIYYPALNTLAHDLHVTNSKINLSITTFMIFQAIAPTFIGGFSDNAGRRPAYMVGYIIYIVANIALALQSSYPALMVLRCLQSSGSSGMVALAQGVIADVVTSAERGKYIGYTAIGSVLGPSLSPVVGGLLSQYLGWKSIFWFLAIFGGVLFLIFLAFLPETCRKVVGDGSIPPPKYSYSLIYYWDEKKRKEAGEAIDYSQREALDRDNHIRFPNPIKTLVLIGEKDTATLLLFGGVMYAGYYCVTTGMPSQLKETYGFNNIEIGLAFLPFSAGSTIAAFTNGRLLDWNYRRHAERLGISMVKGQRQHNLSQFPIEKARIEIGAPLIFIGALIIIAYGWVMDYETNLAGPLILLFLSGYTLIAGMTTLNILLIDTHRQSPATASAAFNLVRCLLGAGASAVVDPMLNAMGRGWTYTFVGLVWILFLPLLMALVKWGPKWRAERSGEQEKKKAKEQEKREKEESSQIDGTEKRIEKGIQ
ncbi:MAG: hypothetical protein M1834_009037 [Cirrosporium novae-zelandiae]|nr:MAG: hypothetical protein M1834_009037 [Cirrosporium novae-zelandiae]